ncbi:hypothetical protein GFS24_24445 [Chitinophaga sp. SYP-B3965]|uniref:hypothetical protein n=1 Tax=Chitinophaga sp. SYP-B3965 TaxID=2663120 RepID=UPI001299B5AD|nr:hypothetical protein [Chitinophaga sp. SYP-B3965]MRG48288.1 hypothetical protein [Chitinophaga sp. SYP-B3965]
MQGKTVVRILTAIGAVVTVMLTILGHSSDLLSVTNFFTGKDHYDEYAKPANSPNTIVIEEKPLKASFPNLTENTERTKLASDIEDNKEFSRDYSKNKNVTFKVVNINSKANNQINSRNVQNIAMEVPPPKKGFGQIALKMICRYRHFNSFGIQIISESGRINQLFGEQYDSSNKIRTTFIKDLFPGKYLIALDFYEFGQDTLLVDMIAGKRISALYTKINPYGEGKGRVVFIASGSSNKWKIILDTIYQGVMKNNDKGVTLNLPAKYYKYSIKNLTPNGVDLDSTVQGLDFKPGETKVINITQVFIRS